MNTTTKLLQETKEMENGKEISLKEKLKSNLLDSNINLTNIKESTHKRVLNGPFLNSSYIGTIIKKTRLKQKLTLKEVTSKICSEAFLSKLEHNTVDSKNRLIPDLCEQLELDYYTLLSLDENHISTKLVGLFIIEDYNTILSLPDESIKGAYIAQDELVKAYKYFINKEYKKLIETVNGMDDIKDCLSDMEFFALILISYAYYEQSLQLSKAYLFLDLLEECVVKDDTIKLFLAECRFGLNCLNGETQIKSLFTTVRDNFTNYTISKQFRISVCYNEAIGTNESLNYLQNQKNDYIPPRYLGKYIFAVSHVQTKLAKYKESIETLKEYKTDDVRFATLYAYNLMMIKKQNDENEEITQKEKEEFIKDRSYLVEFIKGCKQTIGNRYDIAFLRLMQLEIDDVDKLKICEYMKQDLLPLLEDYNYPMYNKYIITRYPTILSSISKYKEACKFLLEHQN